MQTVLVDTLEKTQSTMSTSASKASSAAGNPRNTGNNDDERTDEETDVCYESDDFQVSETQLVAEHTADPVDATVADEEAETWNARTSFTADSPYFDAFLDSETANLNILCETLNGVAARTRTFVKQGIVMSEVTRRLGLACKMRSSDYDGTSASEEEEATKNEESGGAGIVTEEELMQQRRKAVGEEMASILEHLGEVRLWFIDRMR